MMNNLIKFGLASKIFEIRDFDKRNKEEWFFTDFWEKSPHFHAKFNYEQNHNDPPDFFIKSKLDNKLISCELTEIHLDILDLKKGAQSQARIERYHRLLKKLKNELRKTGLSHLYGIFSLKENRKENFESSNILNKNSTEQNQFIADLICILKSLKITSYLDIEYKGFDEHLEYFKCRDMRSLTSERDFYWWFSHLHSGNNESLQINCTKIQDIIFNKSQKLKPYQNNYSQNWLLIYSTDFSLKDSYILPGIFDMELQLSKGGINKDVCSNDEFSQISGCGFDKVYFLSSWFKPILIHES